MHKILDIDESNQKITLDFELILSWNDPYLAENHPNQYYSTKPALAAFKYHRSYDHWPDELQPGIGLFAPEWRLAGAFALDISDQMITVVNPLIGCVRSSCHVVATLEHVINLHHFPFDTQVVCISLTSTYTTSALQYCEYDNGSHMSARRCKILTTGTSEWRVIGQPPLIVDCQDASGASGITYPIMNISFRIRRKAGWYIFNFFL